ncbi:MAG: hypothetical protein C0404_09815 [Verrucomicrobia bacterium]|nr:hypothetical protein [Verrucomicrobiota bacterium]
MKNHTYTNVILRCVALVAGAGLTSASSQQKDDVGHRDMIQLSQVTSNKVAGVAELSLNDEFFIACELGLPQEVGRLLAKGVSVDITDADGDTPLHKAAAGGETNVVNLLLEHGAGVNKTNSYGETPVFIAATRLTTTNNTEDILIAHGAIPRPMELMNVMALRGNVAAVKKLVGDDPSLLEAKAIYPPIIWAAIGGHRDVVQFLIDKKADPNARGERDCTALHKAALHGHPDVVLLLLNAGALVNPRDQDGHTPLSMSKTNTIRELLTARGATH